MGLIGPNGSGKSTLLLHLNGILPEKFAGRTRGSYRRPTITAANLESIRRQVGLLFQDPDDQLFCSTVDEDVAFGPQQLGLGGRRSPRAGSSAPWARWACRAMAIGPRTT